MAEYLNTAVTGSFTLPLFVSTSSANTSSVGSLFYNLEENRVYYTCCQAGSNAWTSAAAQITQKLYGNAVGTANDAFSAAGGAPGTIYTNDTQEYNGISWSSGGNLLFGKVKGGRAGTGTSSGLEIGDRCSGAPGKFVCSGKTQHYDGTSWTIGGSMSYNRYGLAGNGVENAALAFGGVGPSYSVQSATQEYDGSSWSNGGNNINKRQYFTSTGTQNAAIYQGGRQFVSPYCARVESSTYNGTAWSSGPNGITAKTSHGSAGTTNDTYIIGGSTPSGVTCVVETFDGTSWSTSPLNLPSVWYTGGGDNANGSGNAVAFSGWDNCNSLAVSYVLENTPGGIGTTILGAYASGSNTLLSS